MPCKICNRSAETEFCQFHHEAYENLRKKYEDWRKALDIPWLVYLTEIQKNPNSGIWVKETARYLLDSKPTE